MLLAGPGAAVHAQEQINDEQQTTKVAIVSLAAELAHIASRLAGAAAHNGSLGGHIRHRRPHPAAAVPQTQEAAVQNINKGLVQSVPVEFNGHNLTVVALSHDEYVGSHILRTRTPWQADLLGPLMDKVRPGSVVVDAGANMGDFAIFLAAATGPTGVVYAFEPQARMFQLVCTNMIINGLLHMVPMRNALSYEPGELHMSDKVTDGSAGGMEYKDADVNDKVTINYGGMRLGLGGETVPAITLDSMNLTDVSVIKVDIQGAEKLMFYGAQETIKRNLPVVAYESVEAGMATAVDAELQLPQHVKDFNVDTFLKSLGYTTQVFGSDNIGTPPANATAGGRRRMLQGGSRRRILAVPPNRRRQ
uniref:Methyltransferase FkbM domain-containing protein n=1 Tax=Tetradesmus obliquus TaxID=3088 RepID=A0A383W593_TETOB|eukprot:jgi/Sobl393_1/16104/SZX72373.1